MDENFKVDSEKINQDTGEVIAANPCYRKEVKKSYYNLGIVEFVDQDLSRELEEVFEEVPAFTTDPDTGKLLNATSVPQIVSKGFINVYDKIQSHAKEADIYSILEKFAYSGDSALLNARECGYGDLSDLPDNLNDFAQYVNQNFKALEGLNPELAKMVVDDKATPDDIQAKANEIYNERLAEYNKSKESEGKSNE
ncbi:MAG: hypothetical protein K6E24_04250 [bacterium]|nr:hypothetical protein [bacterium]